MRLESFSLDSSNPQSRIPNSIRTIHEVINTGVDLYNQYFSLGGNTADLSKTKLHETLEVQQRLYEESGNLSHLSSLVNMIKKGPQFDTFIQFHHVVRQPANWDHFLQALPDEQHKRLRRLKTAWFRQENYSHFTSDGLFQANEILVELLSRIKQAQAQLAGKASQENRDDDYYLNLLKLEEAIHNEQKSITDALFYRIKLVFSYNNLRAHNPLHELLLSFKELGIDSIQNVKTSDLLSNNFLTETQDNFSVAKAYYLILTHGSEAQKAVVRKFFILDPETHSALVPLKQNTHYSFIPQSLMPFIPRLPQFIINFFPGLKLRAQFFQDKAELFFKLARLNNGLHSFPPPLGS